MGLGLTELEPTGALQEFCALLKRLHAEAGGPKIKSLDNDKDVPLKSSQIYATLAGSIPSPPKWDFVSVFVRRCERHAATHGRQLTLSTSQEEWRAEHTFLVKLWERRERGAVAATGPALPRGAMTGRQLTVQTVTRYPVQGPTIGPARYIGIITGSIRQVRCANVWVNPENTEMLMPRVQEFAISAIIRYEGARRDEANRIVDDLIADELEARAAGRRPFVLGAVVVTGAGELTRRNGVRHIIHVAVVHGEPGAGFRATRDLGRCLDNVLDAAERLTMPAGERVTMFVPLLGTGSGGADVTSAASTLIHTATNYLRTTCHTQIDTVLFQAYTDLDRRACLRAVKAAELGSARKPDG